MKPQLLLAKKVFFSRDGTGCDICIPMPGCVNGGCKSEEINGILVEVAQTCDCHKFSDEHSLTSAVAKFEGPKCDRRKLTIKITIFFVIL